MKLRLFIYLIFLMFLNLNSFAETLIQENYEHGLTNRYDIDETNATVTVVSSQSHSGTYSLNIDIDVAGGNTEIRYSGTASYLGEFHVKIWVKWEAALIATFDNDGEYIRFLAIDDASWFDLVDISIFRTSSTNYLRVRYHDTDTTLDMLALPANDTWHCVEAHIIRDGITGTAEWWCNGVLIDSDTGVDTGDDDGKYIRIWSNSSGVTGEYYMDDIVIDTSKYIGTGWRIQEGVAVGSLPYF